MNDPFRNYDAWKTASPYDDDCDFIVDHGIAGIDLTCPACGEPAKWFQEVTEPGPFNDLTSPEPGDAGWHCKECDWQQEAIEDDFERARAYKETLQPKIAEIRERINNRKRAPSLTLEQFFSWVDGDDDFKYEDSGDGDWHVYSCGNRDCPVGWHKYYPTVDVGRENGKWWVDLGTTDSDGNHDFDCGYDEREPYNMKPDEFADSVGEQLANNLNDYFAGWAEYWLYCAETGTDILGEAYGALDQQRSGKWVEFCVDAAERNANSIEEISR